MHRRCRPGAAVPAGAAAFRGVDPGDRLLTAITAFVQMNGNAEQADLVRDGAVVGVETDPGYAGSNPAGLERPGAGSRSWLMTSSS